MCLTEINQVYYQVRRQKPNLLIRTDPLIFLNFFTGVSLGCNTIGLVILNFKLCAFTVLNNSSLLPSGGSKKVLLLGGRKHHSEMAIQVSFSYRYDFEFMKVGKCD